VRVDDDAREMSPSFAASAVVEGHRREQVRELVADAR
jgi:hypothetical protein|tara:strand:- start:67 stop:177 length:111 start_codon:yes stop_codon:yes gene_type:complete